MTTAEVKRESPGGEPAYFLADHAYCCEFDDGAVILELRGGTYVGVDSQYLASIKSLVHNWPNSASSDRAGLPAEDTDLRRLITDLQKRGILTHSTTPKRRTADPRPTLGFSVTASTAAANAPSIRTVRRFAGALLRTAFWHRDRQLGSLLNWIQLEQHSLSSKANAPDPECLTQAIIHFLRLRLWIYTADKHCLFDSLVLATYLTKQRISCTFIIGVSTKPFTAHAWVQIGELVLNDTAEHVQTFKPILVVGAYI